MQPQHSPQLLRKRKFLLVLPLLVLPFVCIVFAALGGGKGKAGEPTTQTTHPGFNPTLPGAHFAKKESVLTKLGFYEKADEDSAKRLEWLKQDPYHKTLSLAQPTTAATPTSFSPPSSSGRGSTPSLLRETASPDSSADKLLRQLSQLKQALHRPAVPSPPGATWLPASAEVPAMPYPATPGMDRLQHLLQTIRSADTAHSDPQLDKLSGMLDKIVQLQHPAPAAVTTATPTTIPVVDPPALRLPKETTTLEQLADTADVDETLSGPVFYSIDEPQPADTAAPNLIATIVPQGQTVVAGATLLLQLTQPAVLNGVTIPQGQALAGKVSWQNDRLLVHVSSIRYKNIEYAVSLKAFDLDGLEGLNIPGSIGREVVKESADQGISGVGLTTLDPSIGAQAATAGIQAVKTFFSRKVKLVRGFVPAGYQCYLQNTKIVSH